MFARNSRVVLRGQAACSHRPGAHPALLASIVASLVLTYAGPAFPQSSIINLVNQPAAGGDGLLIQSNVIVGQVLRTRCTVPANDCYGIMAEGSHLGGFFLGQIGIAVWGPSILSGNVNVIGTLSKSAGGFKIDHPLDPANKYLTHSFVESPDMMNIYNGVVTLDGNGEAWVGLPDWFDALNKEFRYQLTAIGGPLPNLHIATEVSKSRFKIAGGKSGGKVSWQVTGIRHDAYAQAHRLPVEEAKAKEDRGFYLHPDLFKQPEEKGIFARQFAKRTSVKSQQEERK